MVIEKQVTWLDDYKKEVKTLMYELDNLDQKQLRALSLRLKSNAKNVIADSDYKIPDDYFGVAKSILLEDKNIKDEYKDEFWGLFYPERWQENRMEKCNVPSIFLMMNGYVGT